MTRDFADIRAEGMEPEMTTTTWAGYPMTSPLTQEDILNQAKEGGFVICRLPITKVEGVVSVCASGDSVCIHHSTILAIEPPYADQAAVLRAAIEERDRIIEQLRNRTLVSKPHPPANIDTRWAY